MDDPSAIPPEELVAHAEFVRRIAFAVLRDDADADDAAHDTLTIALERGPAAPSARPSWLATVVRNAATGLRRSAARRHRREHEVARPEAIPSTTDLAAKAEAIRVVAQAVDALEGVERDVVILRHYEDLPPREIAARLCVSVEAVKSRLQRAHARLRAQLDVDGPVAAARRRRALAAFAGLPSATSVGPAASEGTAAGRRVSGSGPRVPGIAVPAGAVLAIGGVVGAVVWGVVWGVGAGFATKGDPAAGGGGRPLSSATERGEPTRGPTGAARPGPLPVLASSGRAVAETPHEAAAPPTVTASPWSDAALEALRTVVPEGTIEGIVFVGATPAVGQRVTIQPAGRPGRRGAGSAADVVEVRTDAEGRFRAAQLGPESHVVRVLVEGQPTRRVVWRGDVPELRKRVVVVLGEGAVVGHVRSRTGAVVVGRTVDAILTKAELRRGAVVVETVTDADGRYALTGLPAGTWSVRADLAAAGASARDFCVEVVDVAAGETVTRALGPTSLPPRWIGIVRSGAGAVIRGPGALLLAPVAGRAGPTCVPFDVEGAFAARVPAGRYRASVQFDGHPTGLHVDVELGDDDVVRDLTVPGVVLAGRVRPRAGVDASAIESDWVGVWPEDAVTDAADAAGVVAPVRAGRVIAGRFRIVGVTPGRFVLRAGRDDRSALGPPVPVVVTDRDLDAHEVSDPR